MTNPKKQRELSAHRALSASRASAWVTLGILLGACAAGGEALDADAPRDDDGSKELVADPQGLLMPSGNDSHTIVKMCWDSSAFTLGANMKRFADARAATVDAIRTSWEANSWLNVTWSDTCSAGMVRVRVADTVDAPNRSTLGVVLNFTFANWGQWCSEGDEARWLGCISTIAMHEFGHVLGFPHEQDRSDGLGIVCEDGMRKPNGSGEFTINYWDVTGIDTESILSYCDEGTWRGGLTQTDIEGLRAVYGGDENPILPNSKAAIRNSDKTYWQGSSGMGPHIAAANIARRSAGGNGLAYGETISVQLKGEFLCGRKGRGGTSRTSPGVVWTTTFDAASCSWTINRPGAAGGDDVLDVNDPFDLYLKLPANGPSEIAFEQRYSGLRMLRVLDAKR